MKKYLPFLIGGLLLIWLCSGTTVFVCDNFSFNETITLEAKEEYTVPEVRTYYRLPLTDSEIPIKTTIYNYVDINQIGSYTIAYDTLFHSRKLSVNVVDTTAPTITLIWDDDYFIREGDPYDEEGFTAYDSYDGDITDKVVKSDIVNGIITYSVSDSSGNSTSVERRIKYIDTTPPTISLSKYYISVKVGGSYSYPSYSASDDRDGDLTSQVSISGSADTSTIGAYPIYFTVKDRAGNSTTERCTVCVYDRQSDDALANPGSKVIYLTFDDGPSANTARLLDILDRYNVKATFFVTDGGGYADMIGEAYRRGHSIGIHTYCHNYGKIYCSEEAFYDDFYKVDNLIYQQTGTHSMISRFPGGSSNTVSKNYCRGIMSALCKSVQNRGYHYFDWNVSSGDAGGASSSTQVFNNVINGCKRRNYCVVLQHDTKSFSVDAVAQIIEWGIANGYTFLPITYGTSTVHHGIAN